MTMLTTTTAQRRVLESLARMQRSEPDGDRLAGVIAGLQDAQRVALAIGDEGFFDFYGCLIDLAAAVRCDLSETETRR